MAERLSLQPIIPFKQGQESSCVVASITMVYRGLGVDVEEEDLIEKYFPTAKLPAEHIDSGVTNKDTLTGMVKIRGDLGLRDEMQIDVFEPGLWEFVRSREYGYIVRADFRALKAYRKAYPKRKIPGDFGDYVDTLKDLVKLGEIDVYTANSKALGLDKKRGGFGFIFRERPSGFYEELRQFARMGHIVGPHGGMTRHTRVLDAVTRTYLPWVSADASEAGHDGFVLVDPRGECYPASVDNLVWVDGFGVRGDSFDRLFRVSPKKEEFDTGLNTRHPLLQHLRNVLFR